MISTRYSFIFLHVPKTGGNAIQTELLPYSDDKKRLNPTQDGKNRFELEGPVTSRKHAFLKDYHAKIGDGVKEYHVALTLRDPFERMVSFYFSPNRWIGKKVCLSEELFVQALDRVLPIRKFLTIGSDLYLPDSVIRFSHLQEDLSQLWQTLNLPTPAPKLPRLNVTAATPGLKQKALESQVLRDLFERRYGDEYHVVDQLLAHCGKSS